MIHISQCVEEVVWDIKKKRVRCFSPKTVRYMDIAKRITELREEAGRRTPPEYIPRLIEYQLKYEKLSQHVVLKGHDEIDKDCHM